jgi:hypothetical protein
MLVAALSALRDDLDDDDGGEKPSRAANRVVRPSRSRKMSRSESFAAV